MEENKMIKQTKFGWVDLSNIPRSGKVFDWKHSAGMMVEFKYIDNTYTMHILEYVDNRHIRVSIDGYINDVFVSTDAILYGELGRALNKRLHDFKYRVGDIVSNTLLIIDSYRKDGRKYYKYMCLHDGYENNILETNLIKGVGCPVCINKVVMKGVNDIATTNYDLATLFYNINDATKYTEHSGMRVDFRCPRCGNKIKACIGDVATRGLSCRKCGDGISYPEKFVYNFLQQLCAKDDIILKTFDTQKIFDWSRNIQQSNSKLSGDKKYDFYIPLSTPIIIEVQGFQHFKPCLFHLYENSRTFDEEQANDVLKMKLAVNNGITPDCYIQLNCFNANFNFIKTSIMNSNLPRLLNFTEEQIDWNQCNQFATSSRVIEVCDLWNSDIHSTKDISTLTNLEQSTVRRYLRRGEELGIVTDPPKHIKRNTQQND